MNTTSIFVLVSSNRPFYLGATTMDLPRRLQQHLDCARRGGNRPVDQFIRSLLDRGEVPTILSVASVSDAMAPLAKAKGIAFLRAKGVKLLNATPDGAPGRLPGTRIPRKRRPFIDSDGMVWLTQRSFARYVGCSQSAVSIALSTGCMVKGHRLRFVSLRGLNVPTKKLLAEVR